MDNELEDRILRALDIRVREPVVLPTICERCGKAIVLDSRAGEMWHIDTAANMDHRPEYKRVALS